jgi:hypothetical protein
MRTGNHHRYGDHDRDEVRGCYNQHHDYPPPGLRNKDLPSSPRLADELDRRLPPPHREHGLVGGHLIPLSPRTLLVVDAFDFEVSESGRLHSL